MGWLFYTLLLVCCFSVRMDEAPTWAELNELSRTLEEVDSGLSTDNRLKRIEKLVNLLLENQELLKGEIMSRLEEIEGKLSGCQPTNPTTTGPTTTEQPTTTTTTGVETTSAPSQPTNPTTIGPTTTEPPTTATPSPKNCQDIYNAGSTTSAVYSIYPDGKEEVRVFCEQELQGGGWTVIQRRIDGTVDFYRVWDEYKRGFGNATGEYWIGNDHLHQLTTYDTLLLVELEDEGETRYANYAQFWIWDEDFNYMLHVYGYSGTAGDSLSYHHGCQFSTRDRDNDEWSDHCAQRRSGAWWYYNCYQSNLNGLYNTDDLNGVTWDGWKGKKTSMSGTRMMIKP